MAGSDDPFKNKLTPEQFQVCRLGGTESPFSGKYDKHFSPGTYRCIACSQELFHSKAKYNSGSGWPSFFDVIESGQVKLIDDFTHNMHRIEVQCSACGSHLGHVFPDGPRPTGLRYCINSLSLEFVPASKAE